MSTSELTPNTSSTPNAADPIGKWNHVKVHTPARLHFGLLSFGGQGRTYGGTGVMIDQPAIQLGAAPAKEFSIDGPSAERIRHFAEAWSKYYQRDLPACQVTVIECPTSHTGLGTGTQLGLATATLLNRIAHHAPTELAELAQSVGRCRRSAVGTYGFALGGLVVEHGKEADEPISPLATRVDLPADWCFVLARPLGSTGLAGAEEISAFGALPAVPDLITRELRGIIEQQMLPAARSQDFAQFARALYHYGHQSGSCFASLQGGPYNGPIIDQLVRHIRTLGVEGVGQSSWGPTVYALVADQQQAAELQDALKQYQDAEIDLSLARVNLSGAQVVVTNAAGQRQESRAFCLPN